MKELARNSAPVPDFIFYVNKPKAERLAEAMAAGVRNAGFKASLTTSMTPRPNSIGVFYGVVPETYAAFLFYKADGRAIYLDNGWLSTPSKPTFRFSWNSVQSFLQDMPPVRKWGTLTDKLPPLRGATVDRRALLILQSRQYFDYLRLGYTRDQWERVTTKILQDKGYDVDRREKPNKRERGAVTFFDQIASASVVVSLNSAATVKALRYGIPAFCMLDCTPSPLAPVKVPECGRAAPPDPKAVDDMCARLMAYEISLDQMKSGEAVDRIMAVPNHQRRGYWYGD